MNFMSGFLKGLALGVAAIAPGISGGALAVIFGLYDKITYFIAHFTRNFKENVLYFLPVGIGGVVGVLVFSKIIEYLFHFYEVEVKYAFIGLMFGTIPFVVKEANKKGYKQRYLIPFVITLSITFLAAYFENNEVNIIMKSGTAPLSLIIYGIIIGFGTIIPGVSASIILMFIGAYEIVISAISNIQISMLFFLATGFVLSILLFSKIICMLFEKAYGITYYAILGLVLGSVISIFPGFALTFDYFLNLIILISCFCLSYSLTKMGKGNKVSS
jgi:putative membrane protein